MEPRLRAFYRASAAVRLVGSLVLSMLFFMMAVGTATLQKNYLGAAADDQSNARVFHKIQSGQTVGYNLLLAAGLSILVTYFFLRRHVDDSKDL